MSTLSLKQPRERGAAIVWVIVTMAVLAVGGFLVWGSRDEAAGTELALTTNVAREKLRVAVVEAGQLKAARSTDIYCKVRGGATILELVDEGTHVKEGDVVIKLDAKSLEDDLTAQKIKFLNAQAARTQAEKAKEIQDSKNASDVDKALLDLALAKTDLIKYVEGDFPLKEKQAESEIKLASADMENKKAQAKDTAELVALDFAAKTEEDRDRLTAEQAEVKLEISEEQAKLLKKFDRPRQMQVLESDVEQKKSELDRVKLRCEADIAQKVADYESKKATFALEESKLKELEEQLHNTTIRAPAAGLVVYPVNQSGGMGGRGGSDRDRVEEGATARENQLLLSLPDTSEMVVSITVHETAVDKLKVGQPALVTIDAIKDMSYFGKVTFIAPLPDSANQWLNPDLKVYRAEITLEGANTGLRPGMSASAEIVIDELLDVVALPIHAVYRRGKRHFVYVADGDGKAVVREVKVGLYNDQRASILSGLEAGTKVFLSVPPGAPQPDFPADSAVAAEISMDELRQRASAIQPKAPHQVGGPDAAGATAAAPAAPGASGASGFNPADMAKLRNMSEEDRAKWWQEQLDKMTPEQKKQFEDRSKGFGGGGGRPGGGDGKRGDAKSGDASGGAGGAKQ